jgi:predicted permease
MWFESRGVSVLAQLPISTRRVVQAKSLLAGTLSLMIPLALAVVSIFKPLTTPYSLILSLIETLAIYSAALLGTTLVCNLFGEGRLPAASFQGHLLKYAFTMIVSSIFMIGPLAAYGLAYLFIGQSHFASTAIMAAAAMIEVIIVNAIARAALKD